MRHLLFYLFALGLFFSCAPTPILVTEEDIGKNNSFICTMIHTEGTSSFGNIWKGAISKSNSRQAKFIDILNSFQNGENISSLNNKGLPYSLSQINKVVSGNSTIQIDAHYSTKNGGLSPQYVGSVKLDMSLEEDILYALIAEIDAENETAFLDVYKVSTDDLREILRIEGDTFGFTQDAYPIIIKKEKIYSNLLFEPIQ